MYFTTALTTAIFAAATASGVAALSAILPPSNPSANGAQGFCSHREECLTMINNVRAEQEGLEPISLPTNWDSLSYPARLFTFMNLERTSRGLNPLSHMVNTYASQVKTAITNDADPEAPSSIDSSWESIWAGGEGMIPLEAMYGWMYYDGPGGDNLDCTSTDNSGCWGHRDAILCADIDTVVAGAGNDAKGNAGYAALFYSCNGTPSEGETVLTWAEEKLKLPSH